MSADGSKALVVSIHDVSPFTREVTEKALEALRADGVERCSLLVVPDHHRRGHFLSDPEFCDWLKARAAEGHEMVVHGYYHQRERRKGEALVQRFLTRHYTADEGEFFDLDRQQALERVERARQEFRSLGLSPTGFIAPAWLLGLEAEAAVRTAGFRYTTRLGSVLRFTDGRHWRSQSLVWSVRSGWRRSVSRRWNAALFRRLASNPLLRVGVHPPDLSFDRIWDQVRAIVRQALEDRTAITYEQWCRWMDKPRPSAPQPPSS